MEEKLRLDQALVEGGHYPSRSRARDAVLRGAVRINGAVADKPSRTVTPADRMSVADAAQAYVSRSGLKLKSALDATGLSPSGRVALDIGASTGGFTQVLLEAGARKVIAIDVGHGQMEASIADDPRVRNLEGVNARTLDRGTLGPDAIGFVVCDVSFISLRLALPPALALAEPGADGIFLVKPQFEVGKRHLGRGGIVRDADVASGVVREIANWLDEQPNWRHTEVLASPMEGGDGNREFLLIGKKNG